MSGFEVGEVAENAANKSIERALQAIYDPISTFVGVSRTKFFEDFGKYYKYVHSRCAFVRTILAKSNPEPLQNIYIPSRFKCDDDQFSDVELIKRARKMERIIVKGNGGTGKTIFFKHLWLTLYSDPQGKIPLFVELRRLNDLTSPSLFAFCRSELQSNTVFSDAVFEKLCDQGKFIFIFDGFDEVERSVRPSVEKQIIQMSFKYPNCGFVLSSRDDDRLRSWQGFKIYSVCDLNLPEVRKLISKIDFDQKCKGKFLEGLTDEFYTQHRHFLSTPLLATMMLMTFYQNASIPDRLTTFYRNAFYTLLLWHDATKDSYERERFLSLDNFRVLFSVFCLISYYKGAHDFEEDALRRTIGASIDYAQKIDQLQNLSHSNIEEIKMDFWQSANLLQKDGIIYSFLHRSFQEYFAAECAMNILNSGTSEILRKFAARHTDLALEMCFEMHPDKVIDEYVAPVFHHLNGLRVFERKPKSRADCLIHFEIGLIFSDNETSRMGIRLANDDLSFVACRYFDEIYSLMRLSAKDKYFSEIEFGIDIVSRMLDKAEIGILRGSGYRLDISITGEKLPSVKLKAMGKHRLPQSKISELKKFIATFLISKFDTAELRLRKDTSALASDVKRILGARQIREKTIEDILGIG